jgi:hypothetical protein
MLAISVIKNYQSSPFKPLNENSTMEHIAYHFDFISENKTSYLSSSMAKNE